MIFLFDLDGTLSDESHRKHLRPDDWDAYYERCGDDGPGPALALAQRLSGNDLWIWSGRRESTRAVTQRWLQTHDVMCGHLNLRPDKCRFKNHDLKRRWLDTLRKRGELSRIACVFEDNPEAAQVYRDAGLVCMLVR